ncbi:hypothetical protein ERO13_A10G216550v2 [Gossypium hirsutum]|nr:hypothetical protein ERO13_A10G216550v2 [Gossypium hirsutum]
MGFRRIPPPRIATAGHRGNFNKMKQVAQHSGGGRGLGAAPYARGLGFEKSVLFVCFFFLIWVLGLV